MKVIKIEESKKDKMSEYAEKALKSMGKLMQCLEELDSGYGERDDDDDYDDDDFGMREGYGRRYDGGGMGERRRRWANGRFR